MMQKTASFKNSLKQLIINRLFMIDASLVATFSLPDTPLAFHLTTEQIEAGLPNVLQSPKDNARVELLVIRPERGERRVLDQVCLSPEGGVNGDYWVNWSWKRLPDGSSHPDEQVTLTNARLVNLLAQKREVGMVRG